MGELKKSAAGFSVVGKSRDQQFNPDKITELLGVSPTEAHAIGDINQRHFKRTGNQRSWDFAKWQISVDRREPGDLNSQIKEIFKLLPDSPSIWQQLHKEYSLIVFCGLWLESFNSGERLDCETLSILSGRNLDIDLDIYQDPDYIHDEDEDTFEFWKQVEANNKGS